MKKITKIASVAMAAIMMLSAVPFTSVSAATAKKAVNSANVATGIKLSWKKTAKAKKYTIYRSTSKTKGFKSVGTTKKITFTDKKAKAGKTYYYKVKASTGATYKVEKAVRLNAPKISSVKVNDLDGISVKWAKVKGAKSYDVYRAKVNNGKTGNYKYQSTVKSTKYTDYLSNSGTYKYKVAAVNGDSVSLKSSAKTLSDYVKSSVVIVMINNDHTGMSLYYDQVKGVDGYRLYRSTDNGTNYTLVADIKAEDAKKTENESYEGLFEYTDTGLVYGEKYLYAIETYKGKSKSIMAASHPELEFTEADVILTIDETSDMFAESVKFVKEMYIGWFGEEYFNQMNFSMTLEIENTEIATVDENGIITGVAPGKTYSYAIVSMEMDGTKVTEKGEEPILIMVKEADANPDQTDTPTTPEIPDTPAEPSLGEDDTSAEEVAPK